MYLVCSLFLLIVVVSPFPVVEIDEEGGEVVLRIPRSLAGVDVTVDSKVEADTATDVAADISGGTKEACGKTIFDVNHCREISNR
ncbi:hypothetical protein QR680_010890 [Steinernema hermaphroditum]|uniref:Uncharacterized protein n=1 Tax=Steinernema hermaphroditum TaxID=289476 RepID=A0AA39ISX1_9BILA|nr:hypothetical protein QR680_010890 [Steinernema hermaphroditum]